MTVGQRLNKGSQRSWRKRIGYDILWLMARFAAITAVEMRSEGRWRIPEAGGGIILSTHQSNFDPVLVGLTVNRRLNYLARKTLFKNPAFTRLIRYLDAIEIDREGSGLAGLKEMLSRLKREELVLMFPEGTRTRDGSVGEMKSGFLPVARRSRVPLLPVAIVGAFDVIPRGTKIPKRHPIAVVYGPVIDAEQVSSLSDDELIQEVSLRLRDSHRRGCELIGKKHSC